MARSIQAADTVRPLRMANAPMMRIAPASMEITVATVGTAAREDKFLHSYCPETVTLMHLRPWWGDRVVATVDVETFKKKKKSSLLLARPGRP